MIALAAASAMAFVEVQTATADDAPMEVTGAVAELSGTCPELKFQIGDQKVSTDAATRFDDGNCDEVANGKRVEVRGVERDGILYARDVELKAIAGGD
ncbi:MAG: hypothetical protein HOV80_28725 [Polyangiaceae bacterium]|nr:hypothetical protein [Polyangiaceae bacterium]